MHIIPAAHQNNLEGKFHGTSVYMKAGKKLKELQEHLGQGETYTVENCGLEGERITFGMQGTSPLHHIFSSLSS